MPAGTSTRLHVRTHVRKVAGTPAAGSVPHRDFLGPGRRPLEKAANHRGRCRRWRPWLAARRVCARRRDTQIMARARIPHGVHARAHGEGAGEWPPGEATHAVASRLPHRRSAGAPLCSRPPGPGGSSSGLATAVRNPAGTQNAAAESMHTPRGQRPLRRTRARHF